MFQEGRDPLVERGFREIARLTGGAYRALRYGSRRGSSPQLLRAAAVYAAGGVKALEAGGGRGKLLLEQMRSR